MVLKFRIAAIALAVSLGCSTAAAQVNAEQVVNIGRNVLAMDDYMLAIQYFNLAARAKPYLAEPYLYRGLAKLMLEDYPGAEADCTEALSRNKFLTEAYKARGFARQNMGRDSLAVLDFDAGLAYDPTDKYFLFYRGVALTELKRYNEADSTFASLLKAYPRFEDGITARARMNLLRGDTARAQADIERSLSISRTIPGTYLMHAQIMADRRRWAEAAADMDSAIRLLPREPELYINRAYVRYNNDDYFGAMADYNYALELNPDNAPALFNRALLRYEVKDLDRSAADLTAVLRLEPDNFHALFNRGLIHLEKGRNRQALADFQSIARRYPKFHTVWFAIAQAYQNLGDTRHAGEAYRRGNDLVARYVRNPQRNPLDRPVISAGKTNQRHGAYSEPEDSTMTDTEVMERFNRLVTVNDRAESRLAYNARSKGRIQDRDARIEPEPLLAFTFMSADASAPSAATRLRELSALNSPGVLKAPLYFGFPQTTSASEAELQRIFEIKNSYDILAARDAGLSPAQYFGRAVARHSLKDYAGAAADFDAALRTDSTFTAAILGRATARAAEALAPAPESSDNTAALNRRALMRSALADFDAALRLDPGLAAAHYDKALLLYALQDLTSALASLNSAIDISPDFGPAYFNRGIIYLRLGRRPQGMADIRKAGELGVLPSYNLLKRMK